MNIPESTTTSSTPTPEPLVWCRRCSTNLSVEWTDHGAWNCECPSCDTTVQVVF